MEKTLWKTVTSAGEAFPDVVAKDPGQALLAFDFDGTLAPMKEDPEAVSMEESSAAALEKIASAGIQIAIISGRPVDSLVALGRLEERPAFAGAVLLGQYGIERLHLGTGARRDPAPPNSIRQAKKELEAIVGEAPGAHLEDKGRALAVHTRRMADPQGAFNAFEPQIRGVADRFDLTVEPGRLVWELRSSSTDKGDALRELVEDFSPGAVLMAGDDLGDLAAFAELDLLRERGTHTCALVSGSVEQPELARRADVLAEGPAGVAQWLEDLAGKL